MSNMNVADEYSELTFKDNLFIGVVSLFALAFWIMLVVNAPYVVLGYALIAATSIFVLWKKVNKPQEHNERQ